VAESHSPLEQFKIIRHIDMDVAGIDFSFTNSSLWMVIGIALITLLMTQGMKQRALVPGRLQSMAELLYEFVAGVLQENAGKKGMQYFPFVFTLFMFILIANLLGMLPIAFTTTSHIVVTFALAMLVFVIVNVIGFMRHGLHFFSLIVPGGVPWYMLILLVPIELLSYLTRPISLSVRLFANMLAGHTMLKVFAGFVIGLGLIGGWLPLAFIVVFTGLEVMIACLQAYVFAVLTCIYLNDALNLHH
jgi:F-type H+-transporting ATPase subunit a